MNFFKVLFSMLSDVRGETDGDTSGQATSAPDKGQADTAPEGTAEAVETTDSPDKGQVSDGEQQTQAQIDINEYNQMKARYEAMMGKMSATERNLASLRQAAEKNGMKPLRDDDGNVHFVPLTKTEKDRVKKFNDEHRQKLSSFFVSDDPEVSKRSANDFLGTISPYLEDTLEDMLERREAQREQERTAQEQLKQAHDNAWEKAKLLYPQVVSTGKEYDKVLFERANQIFVERYSQNPSGELYAVIDAAQELGVNQRQIEQAKVAGVNDGKKNRQILGSPQGNTGKQGTSGFKPMPYDEYKKLTPEKKAEYQKAELEYKANHKG